MEPSTKNCRRRALLNTRHKFSRKSTQPFCEMSDRWRGRRLDGLVGGSRFRCGPAGCRQDLSCLAGHPTTRAGHFLDFGFGPGEHLCVRSSAIDGAGLGIFAKTIFRAGDIITVYDGHVSLRIFAPIYAYQTVCASFDHLHAIPGTEFIIWGFKYPTHARGLGSFANHSRLPNARVLKRSQQFPYVNIHNCPDLNHHLVLIALRDINPDEEVTIKYPRNTCLRLGIPYD